MDHAVRGPDSPGCKRAGIADRQHNSITGKQAGAGLGDRAVRFDILGVDPARLGKQRLHDLFGRVVTEPAIRGEHPVERPSEVDGRRTRAAQRVGRALHCLRFWGRRCGEHQAVGRRDADRRGAAHAHRTDRFGNLTDRLQAKHPRLLREKRLIQEVDPAVPVDERCEHAFEFGEFLVVCHGPMWHGRRTAKRRAGSIRSAGAGTATGRGRPTNGRLEVRPSRERSPPAFMFAAPPGPLYCRVLPILHDAGKEGSGIKGIHWDPGLGSIGQERPVTGPQSMAGKMIGAKLRRQERDCADRRAQGPSLRKTRSDVASELIPDAGCALPPCRALLHWGARRSSRLCLPCGVLLHHVSRRPRCSTR